MKFEREIMVDLETLATNPSATVLTVAAIRFNNNRDYSDITDPYELDYFYARVDLEQPGRDISDDTMAWWASQAADVREEAFGEEDRYKLEDVMMAFNEWARGADRYWANGAAFDFPILESCNSDLGYTSPWQFWQVNDARTIYKLVPDHKNPAGSKHHALYDCLNQIVKLNDCFNKLGRWPKS
jgi:DNA polymerase III epsilon subunit-like protein